MKKEEQHHISGPGLFEHLEDINTVEYNPFDVERPYELTDEEHRKFDSIDGMTKEEIEAAKDVYIKLKGPQRWSSIDKMGKLIRELWYDEAPESKDVTIQVGVNGYKMFKEQWNKL